MNGAETALVWCYLLDLYDRERAHDWLNKPHSLLGDRRPADCSFDEVLPIIEQIKTGILI